MSVLAAIAVLAVLILVHELGHFIAARSQGIHVNRFSLGFGPILWKYQGPETEYAVRAFPLGGFVGFPDDDPDSTIPPNDPNLLRNRPILDRAIVISAGVIANLIFAYLLLVTQVGTVGVQKFVPEPGVLVPVVATDVSSVAAKAGIQPGDVILAIEGKRLEAVPGTLEYVKQTIATHPNQPLELQLQRGDRTLDLTITPERSPEGQGRIGVQLNPNGKLETRRAANILQAFNLGANEFQKIVVLTGQGFV
ncbi:MAG: RIP metalloprotease RseP, partial [Chroococcidiopsis sp.]